jgi:hypothetical protein
MMFYQEMQAVATDVLRDFDQSEGSGDADDGLWFIKVIPGTGPDDDPGPATESAFKLLGAARGVSAKYVDNSLILASDMQMTAAYDPRIDPNTDTNGFVRMDGVRYKVRRIDNIPPAGVTVSHKIFFGK